MAFNEDGTPDKNHDPKAINKSIRKILKIFNQSAYVAYTATPQLIFIFITRQKQLMKALIYILDIL